MRALLVSVLLGTAAAAGADLAVPPKTNLELMLERPIDEKTTAVNTEITFTLVRDLKKGGVLYAPKGATVTGRVTRIQKGMTFVHGTRRAYFLVGLQLASLNSGETMLELTANLESVQPTNTDDYFVPFSHGPGRWGQFEEYRSYFRLPKPLAGESLLGLVREYLRVPKGVRMVFRTPDAR